ncbi:PIN domain-containing protein [Desulfobacterales bacterium HSG17]|nr:PIN domain-containing protein [Desulfobacterales bacterium HSG17]
MANKWFIDTGAYFARFYKRDQYHLNSVNLWNRLENEAIITITTNHVLDELATLLARRTSYDFSSRKLGKIYNSDIRIERPSEKDELKALEFFRKYADQKISFTDCLSFVVMHKLWISQVFTFDKHFEYAGFEIIS